MGPLEEKLIEIMAQNFTFNLLIWNFVLFGVTIQRFFRIQKKYIVPKRLILFFLSSYIPFINFDIILDIFGYFSAELTYCIMGFCSVAVLLTLFYMLKYKKIFNRINVWLIIISFFLSGLLFVVEQAFGAEITIFESIIMFIILCLIYNLIVSALIKIGGK